MLKQINVKSNLLPASTSETDDGDRRASNTNEGINISDNSTNESEKGADTSVAGLLDRLAALLLAGLALLAAVGE
jgi:hypothetical protein